MYHPGGDIDNAGACACVVAGSISEISIWSRFCREPKTVLKSKVLKNELIYPLCLKVNFTGNICRLDVVALDIPLLPLKNQLSLAVLQW